MAGGAASFPRRGWDISLTGTDNSPALGHGWTASSCFTLLLFQTTSEKPDGTYSNQLCTELMVHSALHSQLWFFYLCSPRSVLRTWENCRTIALSHPTLSQMSSLTLPTHHSHMAGVYPGNWLQLLHWRSTSVKIKWNKKIFPPMLSNIIFMILSFYTNIISEQKTKQAEYNTSALKRKKKIQAYHRTQNRKGT